MTTNDYGLTYEAWFAAVDTAVRATAGVSVNDLADFASRDNWADGVDPDDMAAELLEDEGWTR